MWSESSTPSVASTTLGSPAFSTICVTNCQCCFWKGINSRPSGLDFCTSARNRAAAAASSSGFSSITIRIPSDCSMARSFSRYCL